MKKIIAALCCALVLAGLAGCDRGGDATIESYVDFKENTMYYYSVDTDMVSDWRIYYDYIGDGRYQRRIIMGDSMIGELLRLENGKLELTGVLYDFQHHSDLRSMSSNSYALILQEPLTVGAAWVQSQTDDGAINMEVTAEGVEVTVPSGTYTTLEVTTVYEYNDTVQKDYYAPEVGLVKSVSSSSSATVTTVLEKMEEDVALEEEMTVFLPGGGEDRLAVSFETNGGLAEAYNAAAAELLERAYGRVLPEGMLLSAKYGGSGGLTLNFSKSLTDELADVADAVAEQEMLQCIADTFGALYGVEKVYINVEGGAYKSERMEIPLSRHFTPSRTAERVDG